MYIYEKINAGDFLTSPDALPQKIDETGLALLDYGQYFSDSQMLALAAQIGKVVPEISSFMKTDASGCVTRITSTLENDRSRQTISTSGLGMHIDNSFSAVPPRYVMLGCKTAPEPLNGGDTLIAPSSVLFSGLSDFELKVLASSRQRILDEHLVALGSAQDKVVRTLPDNSRYIAYWDAGEYGKVWDFETPEDIAPSEAAELAQKINILAAESAKAIPWRVGRIAVWDNYRFLHGRTAQKAPSKRCLYRVKIEEPLS